MKRDFTELRAAVRMGFAPRDTRPIHEWAAENVYLPLGGSSAPGKFNAKSAPHTIAILEDLKDPAVRQVNILKPIQGVGTTALEVFFLWAMANEPGPAQINYNSEQLRDKNWEPRLLEMIKACPPLKTKLPRDDRKIRKDGLVFADCVPLTVQSATIGNLQGNSIRYQGNDELWEWEDGMFKQADARIEAFRRAGMSKQVNASQGGIWGSEWHRICFSPAASFSEWHQPCPRCGTFQVLKMEKDIDGKKEYLLQWDKDASRIWYVCPFCSQSFEDTAKTKALFINEGKYVTEGELKKHRTRRWNALYWSPWETLVAEYREAIEARKNNLMTPLKTFILKRMADFWQDDDSSPIIQPSTFDIEGALSNGQGIRFLTVDVQKDHLWCLVREWQRDGSSRLLHWGRALSFSDAHEIAKRFEIKEANYREALERQRKGVPMTTAEVIQLLGSGVAVDTGGDRTQEVYDACWRYGWIGLKGASDKREYFKHRETHGGKEIEFQSLRDQTNSILNFESRGSWLRFWIWATVGAKNILSNLRDGKSHRWEVPKNIGHDYMRQINSEVKEDGKWIRLGSRANHAWDCESMQIPLASEAGIFKLPPP
jgi:phage terminase large subunit GpA-like protein